MSKRTLTAAIQTFLSLVGALDAGSLYWAHMKGVSMPCMSGEGCDVVNSSHWAYISGVPVSLFGALTYIVLLFASVLRLTTDSESTASRVNIFLLVASFCGTCYSWYLQYIAAFRIGEFCIYCRVSAITMTLILITSVVAQALSRASSDKEAPAPAADQNLA
ncbi:MAG TPA: vitamin K epoxide reductase family protein [Capsulimonadaceae bacterium]|nr:vitamin K epoxide reductase family protein [Capsulimonadaceae bacterium]